MAFLLFWVIRFINIYGLVSVLCFSFFFLCSFKWHFFVLFGMLGYIGTSINDGPGCLMLRCPEPTCGAAIGQDMIDLLACNEDKEKYARYLRRSYIEDNKKVYDYALNMNYDLPIQIHVDYMLSIFHFHHSVIFLYIPNQSFDIFIMSWLKLN